MKVARLITNYLDHIVVERGLSDNTLKAYRRDLDRYCEWLADHGINEVDQIRPEDIASYQRDLAAGDEAHAPLSTSSLARSTVSVRNLHEFAVAESVAETNPAAEVQVPKTGKRLPKALSVVEVQQLLSSIDTATVLGIRDTCLLEMLYGTGARITEVLSLDVDDISKTLADDEMGLLLTGKGNKQRIVPLGSYARKACDAWLIRGRPAMLEKAGRSTPALFINSLGKRLSRQSAWAILRQRAIQAGINADIGPHCLRHSFATHLLDGGADIRVVQELLGHASVTTTQIYTEVTIDKLREVYLAAHPRARKITR